MIAAGAALKWLAEIVNPLLLAVFLAIMVDGLAVSICRRVPKLGTNAATLLAATMFGLTLAAALVITDNAANFIGSLADYEPRLNAVIARAALAFGLKAETIDERSRSSGRRAATRLRGGRVPGGGHRRRPGADLPRLSGRFAPHLRSPLK